MQGNCAVVWFGETSLNLTHDLPGLLSGQGPGCDETGLGRAPHSPRESMVQYGELAFWRVGQVSVPGPNAGFEKASLVPGCTRRAHDSDGRAALGRVGFHHRVRVNPTLHPTPTVRQRWMHHRQLAPSSNQ